MRMSDDYVIADIWINYEVAVSRSRLLKKWLVFRPQWIDPDKWYIATGYVGYCSVPSAQVARRLAARLASERPIAMLCT